MCQCIKAKLRIKTSLKNSNIFFVIKMSFSVLKLLEKVRYIRLGTNFDFGTKEYMSGICF